MKLRSLFTALALCLLASTASANLGVFQLTSESSQYAANNTLANFTAAAGSGRVLIVTVGDPAATSVGTVTFGGTAMTQIITTTDSVAVDAIYYLRLGTSASPTTGDVVVTSAGAKKFISAVVFSGADQTTPVVAGPLSGPKTANSTLTVSSAPGDVVYDVFDTYKTTPAATVTLGAGQTKVSEQSGTITAGGNSHYFTSKKAGAASVTMSYTSDSEAILHGTINIKLAAATPAPTITSVTGPTAGSYKTGTALSFTVAAAPPSRSRARRPCR
ncbi:MAG: hypothetical protein RL514_3977 [Verrucomicrobiota bacterium]|jgi:hypothetical protein